MALPMTIHISGDRPKLPESKAVVDWQEQIAHVCFAVNAAAIAASVLFETMASCGIKRYDQGLALFFKA